MEDNISTQNSAFKEKLNEMKGKADKLVTSTKAFVTSEETKDKAKKIGKTIWKYRKYIIAAFGAVLSLIGIKALAEDSSDDLGFDSDGDGDIDSWGMDSDGDGIMDTVGVDTDGDGIMDSIGMDSNGDGSLDTVVREARGGGSEILMDTDGDGFIDTVRIDFDGDGNIDAVN